MALLYHLESHKTQGREAAGRQSFVISMFQCIKEKQKVHMKLSEHVQIISATRESKFFSGKLQKLPTICNSTLSEFIQGRIVRVMVFYNSLAIESSYLPTTLQFIIYQKAFWKKNNKATQNEKKKLRIQDSPIFVFK